MTLVDTHSHIYLPEFEDDRAAMLKRAENEGITRIYMPAIDSTTHQSMLDLEEKHPEICRAMIGLHPCSVNEKHVAEMTVVRRYLENRVFPAIGEIGLDYYWDLTHVEQQKKAFQTQIDWALEFDIPIVIHSRNAIDDCIKMVGENQKGKLRGVFHCFSGNEEQANQVIDLGFYLGIGGVVTFKNAGLDKVMEKISLEHVVLETDAPYLAPVPFRGKRNEPSYIKYVVEKLAIIKNQTIEEIVLITTANAGKLFV